MIYLLIIGLLCWYTIKVYNRVKPLEISIGESLSNIGIINQKRQTIINKLNEIVSSYSRYEKGIIEGLSSDMKNNGNSTFNINRLYDAYPDLKLNETFSDLMDRLYSIESERQNIIEYYNNRIKNYNREVTSFPALLVCNAISFREKTFFN
jgi:LemA protein